MSGAEPVRTSGRRLEKAAREEQRAAQELEELSASRICQYKRGDVVWALCHSSFLAEHRCMWYQATVSAVESDKDGVWYYHLQYHIDGDLEVLPGKYVCSSQPAKNSVVPALAERSRQAAEALAAAPLDALVSAGPRRPGVTQSMRRSMPPRAAPYTERPLRRTGRSVEKPTILD